MRIAGKGMPKTLRVGNHSFKLNDMKKYVLGFVALIAVIVFSAFTITKDKQADPTLFYFYEVVNGQVNPLAPLNSEPMTFQEFESDLPISCPEGDDADCIRAWVHTYTPSASESSDNVIRKLVE